MSQPSQAIAERRSAPRRPAAFAFWFQPERAATRAGAWMLNVAPGGAAFLAAAEDAPVVGDRIRLTEMFSQDRMVREGSLSLPTFARVLRTDNQPGITQRVAVRYEADVPGPLREAELSCSVMACPEQLRPAPPPPLTTAPGGGADQQLHCGALPV